MPILHAKASNYPSLFGRKKRKRVSVVTKLKRSYVRPKRKNLMVNPNYRISSSFRQPWPDKFRTKLNMTFTAVEGTGQTPGNFFNVWLNGLYLPFSTGASIPGTMIDGSSSQAATASPLGFLSLMGSNNVSGLYQQYCVLNASFKVSYMPIAAIDSSYFCIAPIKGGTTFTINTIDEYPYSKGPKFASIAQSTKQNELSGRINMAKFLGYENDLQYAAAAGNRGTLTTNPSTAINQVFLAVYRNQLTDTALSAPMACTVQISYDVEFQQIANDLSE